MLLRLRNTTCAGALTLLFLSSGIFASLFAQDAASAATGQSSSSAPNPTLPYLMQHRDLWPAQLTLTAPVRLSIVSNGKEVGAVVSPEGTTVDLVSVSETGLVVQVMAARASISPDQTDLWARVAAASAKANSLPPPAPPAQTPSPAESPAAPSPALLPHAAVPPVFAPGATAPAPATNGPNLLLNDEVTPRDNFTKAAFRFWSPAYQQPIRGVIVLVPGFSQDGRGMIDNSAWQGLARKYRLALVSCYLQGGDYHDAMRGTGDALLEALKEFADKASHAEVSQAPLLLYGESAGGQFNYNFTLWKPERVMAFVVNKGAYYDRDEPDSRMCSVPGLFFLGSKDSELRINAITEIWTVGRKLGALWALAPQPNSGHEFSKTPPVARVFFEGVLKNCLPDESLSSDDNALMKPMQENQGWLGDLATHQIHDGSSDIEPNRAQAWLPDQASAAAWKAFVAP
jgi:hypothetical protein